MSIDESRQASRPSRRAGDERWYLTDERDFLQRSLADADREREAGDLSDEDHAVLVTRDSAAIGRGGTRARRTRGRRRRHADQPHGRRHRIARARRGRAGRPERPPMPLWRKLGIVAACLLIASAR